MEGWLKGDANGRLLSLFNSKRMMFFGDHVPLKSIQHLGGIALAQSKLIAFAHSTRGTVPSPTRIQSTTFELKYTQSQVKQGKF